LSAFDVFCVRSADCRAGAQYDESGQARKTTLAAGGSDGGASVVGALPTSLLFPPETDDADVETIPLHDPTKHSTVLDCPV